MFDGKRSGKLPSTPDNPAAAVVETSGLRSGPHHSRTHGVRSGIRRVRCGKRVKENGCPFCLGTR